MVKEKMIFTRDTVEAYEALKLAAKQEQRSMSDLVRNLLRADLRARGLWPPQGPGAPAGGVKC